MYKAVTIWLTLGGTPMQIHRYVKEIYDVGCIDVKKYLTVDLA